MRRKGKTAKFILGLVNHYSVIILAKILHLMSPREILNILGIVLPALIIIISLFRPSLRTMAQKAGRAKLVNFLVMFIAVLLLLAGLVRFFFFPGNGARAKGPDPTPLQVSKHSEAFNKSVDSLLNAYYSMAEAFVNWDSAAVVKDAATIKGVLNNLNIDELKADTTGIYESALDPLANAKGATDGILNTPGIDNKRRSFNDLSDNIRMLFIVVQYDNNKVYWNECPMAFGEGNSGFWLSKTDQVRNPYLGLHHPVYKDEMLQCGGPRDTINFMKADSLKN